MKIRLNIDKERFNSKPKGQQTIGAIRNRLCSPASIREIDADRLSIAVSQGRTFTPAEMTGTKGDSWKGQQVICADIDNDSGTKDENDKPIMIDNPMTPEEAAKAMLQYGIDPYFMYSTFSSRADWPKFRVVLILDEAITDPKEAETITTRFTGIFNRAIPHCADTSIYDNARLLFGGRADSIMYESKVITPLGTLRTLPEPPQDDNEADNPPPQQITKPKGTDSNKKGMGGSYEALLDQFEADKATFDLVGYVHQTTSSRPHRIGAKTFYNPCPICGHNDCFNVTGALWHCFSTNHTGINSGTIIQYLMAKDKLEYGNACDIFKFDIMRYDREEWKKAWIESQRGTSEETFDWDAIIDTDDTEEDPNTEQEPADEPPQDNTAHLQEQGDPAQMKDQKQERKPANSVDLMAQFLQRAEAGVYKPMPTGIPVLDAALDGGLLKQTLVVIGAAPGMGKSVFAHQLVEQIAEVGTADTLYYSLEMSTDQMMARTLARLTGIPQNRIMKLYELTEEEKALVYSEAQQFSSTTAEHIAFNPPDEEGKNSGSAFIQKIYESMKIEARLRDLSKPLITVIDYLQYVQDGSQKMEEVETLKTALKMFKDFAIHTNGIVIVIVANSRDANKRGTATQSDARDTSGIEYTADVQMGINYVLELAGKDVKNIDSFEKQLNKMPPDRAEFIRNQRVITITKNRFGKMGRIYATFDGATSQFIDFTAVHPKDQVFEYEEEEEE